MGQVGGMRGIEGRGWSKGFGCSWDGYEKESIEQFPVTSTQIKSEERMKQTCNKPFPHIPVSGAYLAYPQH